MTMKIGVIADTHDNLPKIEKAVEVFNREKTDLVLHAGDYVAPFSLNVLGKLNCPYKGIFGNNDGERAGLTQKSNGAIGEEPLEFELHDRSILLLHYLPDPGEVVASKKFNLIISAHTHKLEIKKQNGVLVVNPGECGGWLYGESTVAVVDLERLEAKEVKIS